MTEKPKQSAAAVAAIGFLALASAMGIGRFSLTPILPLMQRGERLRSGRRIGMGDAPARPSWPGGMVRAGLCWCRRRDRLCRTVWLGSRHRGLEVARDLDRARRGRGRARGAALAQAWRPQAWRRQAWRPQAWRPQA